MPAILGGACPCQQRPKGEKGTFIYGINTPLWECKTEDYLDLMLFHGHVLIKAAKFRAQSDACTTLPLMLIDVLVHFAICCGVPIRMNSVLESFSLMLCIQLLISLMHRSRLIVTIHRIRVESTVYLMVISVGMSQFPMLSNGIENWARVLHKFNRT